MYTPPPPEQFDIADSNACIGLALWVATQSKVTGSFAVVIPAGTGTVAIIEDCPSDTNEARTLIVRKLHTLSHPSVLDVAVVTVSDAGFAEYWRLNGTDVVLYPVIDEPAS